MVKNDSKYLYVWCKCLQLPFIFKKQSKIDKITTISFIFLKFMFRMIEIQENNIFGGIKTN